MAEYPNSGKLSANKYKQQGDKKPDMTGELTMTRSTLKELLDQHTDDDIVIKLSAWQMSGQWGPWLRMSWNNYKPASEAPAPAPKQVSLPDEDLPF